MGRKLQTRSLWHLLNRKNAYGNMENKQHPTLQAFIDKYLVNQSVEVSDLVKVALQVGVSVGALETYEQMMKIKKLEAQITKLKQKPRKP